MGWSDRYDAPATSTKTPAPVKITVFCKPILKNTATAQPNQIDNNKNKIILVANCLGKFFHGRSAESDSICSQDFIPPWLERWIIPGIIPWSEQSVNGDAHTKLPLKEKTNRTAIASTERYLLAASLPAPVICLYMESSLSWYYYIASKNSSHIIEFSLLCLFYLLTSGCSLPPVPGTPDYPGPQRHIVPRLYKCLGFITWIRRVFTHHSDASSPPRCPHWFCRFHYSFAISLHSS